MVRAQQTCSTLGIDCDEPTTRMRKRKRFHDDLAQDVESNLSLQQSHRKTLFSSLDMVRQQINDRFIKMAAVRDDFRCILPSFLCAMTDEELQLHSADLCLKYENDILSA